MYHADPEFSSVCKTYNTQREIIAMNLAVEHHPPRNKNPSPLHIVKVEKRETLNEFIRLVWPLYKDDPAWVPPLMLERRTQFAPSNPYFEHATYSTWVAYREGKPVGRISAQVDRLHLEQHQDATGFFGMLESENNP